MIWTKTASGLQSLEDRSSIEVLILVAEFKRITDPPPPPPPNKRTEERLRGSALPIILERQRPELLDHMSDPIPKHAAVPCWERQKFPIFFTCIRSIERKATQSDPGKDPLPCRTLMQTIHRSAHRSTLMDLPSKPPGMEVEGPTSDIEQTKSTSLWRLGGSSRTSKQKLWQWTQQQLRY